MGEGFLLYGGSGFRSRNAFSSLCECIPVLAIELSEYLREPLNQSDGSIEHAQRGVPVTWMAFALRFLGRLSDLILACRRMGAGLGVALRYRSP